MMSIFKKFSRRTTLIAVIGSLVVAGSALAYFAAGVSFGTAAGNTATTDKPATINLALTGPAAVGQDSPIKPNGVHHTYQFTIKNPSESVANITGYTVALGLPQGCDSKWFQSAQDNFGVKPDGTGTQLAAGATDTVNYSLWMPTSSVDQSACEGLTPSLTLNAY